VFKIGISTGLLSILTLLAYFALNPSEDLRLLLAFTAGAMFITVFNALRICLTASGQTRTVIALSSFATLMTILSLVIAGGIFKLTGVSLISSFFIGLVLSTSLIVLSLRRRAVKRQNLNTKLSAKKDTVQGNFVEFFTLEYLHVLFITFILLLLVNFPVMVAPLLSVEPEFLIEWFSIAVLVRIPLAILNSFTPPILNKVASLQLIKNGLATKILMEKSFQIYFLISICIVLSMAVMGPFVVGLLTDSKYEPSVSMCLLIASIEALVALFGLLRAFLVAIGGEIKLIKFLLFGLVLYLFILLTPINPELRLFLAPIVVTSFLMLVASREVLRRLMTIKE
jgi:O-antigen/teichoic acid export membrane protein